MNKNNVTVSSETDWRAFDLMEDEDIDTSDIPPLDEQFFAEAQIRLPTKQRQIVVEIDADIWSWLNSLQGGYNQNINQLLRHQMEAIVQN